MIGVPMTTPVGGYGNNTVNTLRLWSRGLQEFDLKYFPFEDYLKAVEEKNISEIFPKSCIPIMKSTKARNCGFGSSIFCVLLHTGHYPLPDTTVV
ncbi:MAG: glycogen/starch/alpha-glucan phosphorylase [Desulfobacterales bacterium]